jgi:glycosyltransferase involved in cell wall biosynthesis
MSNFLISVIITNFNKSEFLEKNIKSLLKQTYKKFEIIIFDDCSTDNSIKIINENIKKFTKFRLIVNKKKKFEYSALNQINGIIKSFRYVKGDIICLMDADDFFKKDKLKEVNNYFNYNKKSRIVYDFPSCHENQFKYKDKCKTYIWPTIFPTSCISLKKEHFLFFIKNIKKNDFQFLEVDARINIFYNFFYHEYNKINKKLTIYNYDQKGISAKIKKLSKKWWIRRDEAFKYLKYTLKIKNKRLAYNLDYFITKIISFFCKNLF